MIKGIIFDYNGVFSGADWYWTLLEEKLENFEERKQEFITLADRADLGEITPDEFESAVAEHLGITRGILETFRRNLYSRPDYVRTSLVELTETLQKEYRIGLLSNYSATTLRPLLEKYDLERLFQVVGISSEIGAVKPDPMAFDYVIEKLDLQRDEVLFVDDNERHVVAARELGIQAVVFTSTMEFKQYLQENDISIS
jgi:HAD superfamily hydrolase (TIGR01509 family)